MCFESSFRRHRFSKDLVCLWCCLYMCVLSILVGFFFFLLQFHSLSLSVNCWAFLFSRAINQFSLIESPHIVGIYFMDDLNRWQHIFSSGYTFNTYMLKLQCWYSDSIWSSLHGFIRVFMCSQWRPLFPWLSECVNV